MRVHIGRIEQSIISMCVLVSERSKFFLMYRYLAWWLTLSIGRGRVHRSGFNDGRTTNIASGIFRRKHRQHAMHRCDIARDVARSDVACSLSVYLSVCLCVWYIAEPCDTAEPTEMLTGMLACVGPGNHVLDRGPDNHRTRHVGFSRLLPNSVQTGQPLNPNFATGWLSGNDTARCYITSYTFYRATLCLRDICRRCVSDTLQYCMKTAKHMITQK